MSLDDGQCPNPRDPEHGGHCATCAGLSEARTRKLREQEQRIAELEAALKSSVPLYSEKKGHRWVLTRGKRTEMCRCVDCAAMWPTYGDLAPMPECSGNEHDRRAP